MDTEQYTGTLFGINNSFPPFALDINSSPGSILLPPRASPSLDAQLPISILSNVISFKYTGPQKIIFVPVDRERYGGHFFHHFLESFSAPIDISSLFSAMGLAESSESGGLSSPGPLDIPEYLVFKYCRYLQLLEFRGDIPQWFFAFPTSYAAETEPIVTSLYTTRLIPNLFPFLFSIDIASHNLSSLEPLTYIQSLYSLVTNEATVLLTLKNQSQNISSSIKKKSFPNIQFLSVAKFLSVVAKNRSAFTEFKMVTFVAEMGFWPNFFSLFPTLLQEIYWVKKDHLNSAHFIGKNAPFSPGASIPGFYYHSYKSSNNYRYQQFLVRSSMFSFNIGPTVHVASNQIWAYEKSFYFKNESVNIDETNSINWRFIPRIPFKNLQFAREVVLWPPQDAQDSDDFQLPFRDDQDSDFSLPSWIHTLKFHMFPLLKLPEALRNPKRRSIAGEFITDIIFENSKLLNLPSDAFSEFPRLSRLSFVKSKWFASFPKFSFCQNLQVLNLSFTPIPTIDPTLSLKKLRKLLLVNTVHLSLMPDLDCPNLKEIILQGSGVSAFSEDFGSRLISLDCLNISSTSRLKHLPNLKSSNLTQLIAENSSFISMDKNFGSFMPKLQSILLHKSKLLSLPNIDCPGLITLDITKTKISKISNKFGSLLDLLEKFSCSSEKLTKLPNIKGKSLKEIDLAYSSIKTIHFEFGANSELPNLEILNLKKTKQLTTVPNLQLPRLQLLDLESSGVVKLLDGFGKGTPLLERLDMSNTFKFFHLGNIVGENLQWISLKNSSLNSMSANFGMYTPKLQFLDLSFTMSLSHMPNLRCEQLKLLNLSGSRIKTFHSEFGTHLSNLETLDLSKTFFLETLPNFQCVHLKELKLRGSCISSIDPQFGSLFVSFNKLSGISSLNNISKLEMEHLKSLNKVFK